MRIHDKLTLLSLSKRRDLLFVMCGGGGGRISRGYCGECILRLTNFVTADAFVALNLCTEARNYNGCWNCEVQGNNPHGRF